MNGPALLSIQNTSLTLLATDGLFTVTFAPRLTPTQYAGLAEIVGQGIHSKQDFCGHFAKLSEVWGIRFSSDGTCDE
jgi:hypothetical protein